MNCKNCGNFNSEGNFCIHCGAPLTGTNNPQQYNEPLKVGSLTINRQSQYYGALIPFDVFVDGVLIGSLKTGESKSFPLYYGNHMLQVKGGMGSSNNIPIVINDMQRNLVYNAKMLVGYVVNDIQLTFVNYYN
jgi:hypothetical protein